MNEWQLEIPFPTDTTSDVVDEHDLLPDDIPEAYRYEYAQPIELQKQAYHLGSVHRELMKAARGPEAYHDLGGNVPERIDHLTELAEYLDDEKVPEYDIIDSFERLDILHSLDVSEYIKMTKKDKKILALHMVNHLHTLEVRAGAIGADAGYKDPNYSSYGFSSDNEAEVYSRSLIRFTRLIKSSDGYKAMQDELKAIYPDKKARSNSIRDEYRNHHQMLYVVRDTKSDKLRIHIEHVRSQIKASA